MLIYVARKHDAKGKTSSTTDECRMQCTPVLEQRLQRSPWAAQKRGGKLMPDVIY